MRIQTLQHFCFLIHVFAFYSTADAEHPFDLIELIIKYYSVGKNSTIFTLKHFTSIQSVHESLSGYDSSSSKSTPSPGTIQ